jgi:ABC-type transporter Mla subunit MlaD
VTSLADLEARVAALEADRADYRAVLASVGALSGRVHALSDRVDGLTERLQTVEIKIDANGEAINALGEKLAGFQNETRTRFEALEQKSDSRYHEANRRFNSVDEQLAEIKDLIIDRRGGR